ncbi:DinB family protein [Mucilaginibacter sp. RS28]|uniref:DinB family protein n=1 Tax=Mucilaginibacter straminoryzae TaxID=2932774 RepID=A0A9X1WZZ3_9SPHI|nr:DinB family protein [Mucilaginibacter straminoryzae]MCJ8208523.1 DinB family protein [Mucilaginibacter straminoryzae]
MSQIKIFTEELANEAVTTRKMLGRIPSDQFAWQPHQRSMTIKRLATHIGDLPGWIQMVLDTDELDFQNTTWAEPDLNTTEEVLAFFEESLKKAKKSLSEANEEELDKIWTLRSGEAIYDRSTKAQVIRMCLNQIVHHRAQMGVYLRLLDIPIPGSYGPSADEHEDMIPKEETEAAS